MMLNIVSKEYRDGIQEGKVINADEYAESQVFLEQARDRYDLIASEGKPPSPVDSLKKQFATLKTIVESKEASSKISNAIETLNAALVTQFDLKIHKTPVEPVSLENGKALYLKNCVRCHGPSGEADGPDAAKLDPPPARLADPQLTGDGLTDPFDNFQIISVGIANTAMQPWADKLTEEQRWDLTYYVRSFSNTNVKLPVIQETAVVDATSSTGSGSSETERAVAEIESILHQAMTAYQKGDTAQARLFTVDAYLVFDRIEPAIVNKDKSLGLGLERTFGTLQGQIKQGAPVPEIISTRQKISDGLKEAEALLSQKMGFWGLFWNSLAIIVREGFEAILILAALITFLVKSKNEDKVQYIYLGMVGAIVASFLTAWILESVFQIQDSQREQMEGWIMLIAVGMLFWVSYWLVSKVEAAKWQSYITGKMKEAITTGSSVTLAMVAFFSVYREGFETILFYKALYIQSGDNSAGIMPGLLIGTLVLAVVFYLIHKVGIRIPIKWFFLVTSGFLAFMAFLFLGQGIHALQMGDALSLTRAAWAPEISWLGMYATMETFFAQILLVAIYTFSMIYTLTKKADS